MERVDLSRAADEALGRWKQPAGPQTPVSPDLAFQDVDAAVLAQLLDLGLEYALQGGTGADVEATLQGTPARPMLAIKAQQTDRTDDVHTSGVELHWLLFACLARAAGLAPSRRTEGGTVTLGLGFRGADSARVPDGLPGTAEVTRTASVVGRRVLLIELQEMTRLAAYRLMHDAGMRVDAYAGLDKARANLGDDWPDIVVTGLPVDDVSFSAFLDDARAARPRLRVAQLVDDADAFSFSVPAANRPAQIARNGLEHTLVSAVAEELDAAWAE